MNKKGFTTVELILTMAVVIVIMATITSVTYTYRDRSNYEQLVTDMTNYKNTVTKIIYDDILNIKQSEEITKGKVIKIEKINDYNYKLITENNDFYSLQIINETNKLGIKYDGVEYIVPNSNTTFTTFEGVNFSEDSGIYTLDIYFNHKYLENNFKIHLVVSE